MHAAQRISVQLDHWTLVTLAACVACMHDAPAALAAARTGPVGMATPARRTRSKSPWWNPTPVPGTDAPDLPTGLGLEDRTPRRGGAPRSREPRRSRTWCARRRARPCAQCAGPARSPLLGLDGDGIKMREERTRASARARATAPAAQHACVGLGPVAARPEEKNC